ncbi:MAG: hypothetical protein KGP28_03185 [Bdellovibrionales bacterium]|nr:hypothetical protein [Bdellovibrionales bacterium]
MNYTIYLAGGDVPDTPASSGFYNSTQGYRFITTTASNSANLIWLDVSTNKQLTVNEGQHIVVTVSTPGSASGIRLKGAGILSDNIAPPDCNGTACQGVGSYFSARYNPGSVLRISFSVQDLCAGSSGGLCNTATGTPGYQDFGAAGSTLTQPINVTFGVVNDSFVSGPVSGENTDTGGFTLGISNIPPTVTCPAVTDAYFPGDQQVYITPSSYAATVGSGSSGSGVDLKYLVFLGGISNSNPFTTNAVPSNEIVSYVDTTLGTQAVTGFTNTTNGSDNAYTARIYAQNAVGIVSPLDASCALSGITSQPIQGILTESKCFIATAAYQDGRSAPVMMLRRFRDQILSKTALGRKFIEKYYKYSPALAEWAWDKHWVRSLALRALAPLELFAWTALQLVPSAEAADTTKKPVQPYIDRVKGWLEKEGSAKSEPQESYTGQMKKKLGEKPEPKGISPYIDRVKSGLEPVPSGEGYTNLERANLPPVEDQESVIERVQAGIDKMRDPKRPPIKEAFGFMLGVSPGLEVVNTEGSRTFTQIYGGGWVPEFTLHYERQFFHSENFGSFGLGIDSGASIASGFGQLRFPFNGTTVSQTRFTFVQIPLMASAYYRFNLMRVLRPYAGGSVGPILFSEFRKDNVSDKRGYSFAYVTHLGASLLLDFFDRSTARESYLSLGVQHSYLFVEYLYQSSFNQSGVVIGRSGIYSGFLFEI